MLTGRESAGLTETVPPFKRSAKAHTATYGANKVPMLSAMLSCMYSRVRAAQLGCC